jgi:hypothetical protein
LRSNVQYPSANLHHSISYPTKHNTTTMAGKGSSKWSRSIGGDAQQPSASKKKCSPGTDAVDNDATPSNATAGLPLIPQLTMTRSMEKAPLTMPLPQMPLGATPPIPPSMMTLAKVPLPPTGPQMLFAMPQMPPQVLMATTKNKQRCHQHGRFVPYS